MGAHLDQMEKTPAVMDHPAKQGRRGKVIRRVILYPLLLYATYCVAMFFFQEHLLFPSDMAPAPAPTTDRYARNTTVIKIEVDGGGTNEAWFIPAVNASATNPAPVVVFFHGNAEIIDYLDEIVLPYRQLGMSVYLPEYRGYGRGKGRPSEAVILVDALRFYDELIKRPDVDRSRIVLHGRSLGGGPATYLASQRPAKALVLQSVFTSTADMANTFGAPGFVARHPFRNDRIIPTLDMPILIAHGTSDDVIPFAQGRKLASLAKRATFREYPCNHNGFPGDGHEEEWWNEVSTFLRTAGVLPEVKP
ncbi:MAG: alpha/beta hydrolase [Planctomycetes bacterium]|nr:alpha/beta hydrolase [Planctomycetota bacterium]